MSRTLSPQLWNAIEDVTPLGIARAGGLTANIPAAASKGYAPGCLFHVWNATTAFGALYINIGTAASSNFVPVSTAGSTLGFIDLPLESWRAIASTDFAGATGTPPSGILAVDTAPKLIRTNAATDKAAIIQWAASGVIEIQNTFAYPPDLDFTAAIKVHIVAKVAASDVPVITLGYFEGIGDTTRGGATSALTSSYQDLVVSVTPTAGHPMFANITLTPGTHTTDTLSVKQTYILYTKKALAS